jgi:hypothetical protein
MPGLGAARAFEAIQIAALGVCICIKRVNVCVTRRDAVL